MTQLRLEAVKLMPGPIILGTYDSENVDADKVFEDIQAVLGYTPGVYTYFRCEDLGDHRFYDMAVRFEQKYLETATHENLDHDYRVVAEALPRLAKVLNEGGFKDDHS